VSLRPVPTTRSRSWQPTPGRSPLQAFTSAQAELLGEMGHERGNAERLQAQWRLDARNVLARQSPHLVPGRDLARTWQELYIALVRTIPDVLAAEGYFVYQTG
jgi:hypothetical protein